MSSLAAGLSVYKTMSLRVPAYRQMLVELGIDKIKINAKTFHKLPLLDKQNYISKFHWQDRLIKNAFPPIIYASSGSTGKPTYWFRGQAQTQAGGRFHERIFREIFKIKKNEPTLVIVCFSMGVWVAGLFTVDTISWMNGKGYQISTLSAGMEKQDILQALKNLSAKFKHIVIASYPPFLNSLLAENEIKAMLQNAAKLHILTAGDKFTEQWRDAVANTCPNINPVTDIVNIYGSADATVLAHETPLTIFLRREATRNKQLSRLLFGSDNTEPGLYQFDPNHITIENFRGELIVSVDNGVPLCRYNTRDRGEIVDLKFLNASLKKLGLWQKAKQYAEFQKFGPLVSVKGRSDVAVTFYALNIYPEHIKKCIETNKHSSLLSENYYIYASYAKQMREQELHLELEMIPGITPPDQRTVKAIGQGINATLQKINIEYRKLTTSLGSKATINIKLFPFGSKAMGKTAKKGFVGYKNKKTKLIANHD